MKKYLFSLLFILLLSSCGQVSQQTSPPLPSVPIPAPVPLPPVATSVSSEADFHAKINTINLSDAESDKIVRQLLTKRNVESQNTGLLVQWEWRVVYNPPGYPDKYDSITVTISGKTYTFPWVYWKEERARYLKNIWAWNGCVSYNGEINHGNCMSGVRIFKSFDSLSPSGKYLIYSELSMGWGASYIVDLQSGQLQLRTDFMSLIQWTTDNRLIYYTPQSGWQPEQYGLFITRKWNFSEKQKIADDRRAVSLSVDDSYVYLLEEDIDYTLRIFDRANYEEVYTRIVKK